MKKEDVKIGMKVVPFQKTVKGWEGLETSCVWKKTKEKGQNYLCINEYDENEGCYVLGFEETDGDFFNVEDFKPYVEKFEIKKETKVHIHTILPYTFNAIVTSPDGTIIQTQINPGSKPSYKAIYQGNKTIIILADGSKGVSKCSPEDKYDLQKGHDIAMVRAKMKSLVKELKKLRK
jgi:hypothetical protein